MPLSTPLRAPEIATLTIAATTSAAEPVPCNDTLGALAAGGPRDCRTRHTRRHRAGRSRAGGHDQGQPHDLRSGSERQRLALARALLSEPDLLLLDESTSNLDGRNEMLAREAIQRVSGTCTVLVVAHRLSTVVDSDLILVFEDGRIVARGTHESLLAESDLYRELAQHQLIS